jgi:hypothetical protein
MGFWWKVWCAKSWWRRMAWRVGKMIREKIKPHKSSYQIWCLGSWRRADLWWRWIIWNSFCFNLNTNLDFSKRKSQSISSLL